MSLDPKIKSRWITDLLSDEYPQSKGCLRDNYGYCCLGVFCDIMNPNGWIAPSTRYSEMFVHEGGQHDIPSARLLDDAGLTQDQAERLAGMNDTGDSFARIADYIERNL